MKTKLTIVLLTALLSAQAMAKRAFPLAYLTMDGIHASQSGIMYAAAGFDGSKVYYISPEGDVFDFGLGLEGPIDITDDAEGNLYVTNLNADKVSKIAPDGTVSDFATTNPGPAGITSDAEGNLYVSHYGQGDGDGSTILKITPQGEVSTYAEGGLLQAPIGITFDDAGNLFTANFNNGDIIKISPEGEQSLLASIPSEAGFAVGHLAFANNRLFATGLVDQKIYVIKMNGRVNVRDIVPEGDFPNGITFNPVTSEVLFVNTFAPASAFRRIRIKSD